MIIRLPGGLPQGAHHSGIACCALPGDMTLLRKWEGKPNSNHCNEGDQLHPRSLQLSLISAASGCPEGRTLGQRSELSFCLSLQPLLFLQLTLWFSGGRQHGACPGEAGYGASGRNDQVRHAGEVLAGVMVLCRYLTERCENLCEKVQELSTQLGRKERLSFSQWLTLLWSLAFQETGKTIIRRIEYGSPSIMIHDAGFIPFGSEIQTRLDMILDMY